MTLLVLDRREFRELLDVASSVAAELGRIATQRRDELDQVGEATLRPPSSSLPHDRSDRCLVGQLVR